MICSVFGCNRSGHHSGMCIHHRKDYLAGRPLVATACSVDGCDEPKRGGLGFRKCEYHAGRTITPDGYVLLEVSDGSGNRLRMLEHREIIATELGRELYPDENVHHKNGVRHDNRRENLELWSTSQPSGQRVEDKVSWAKEILCRYKDWEAV
ncbi:HNH endonuclease [Microbacterium phage Roman]|nr:HNH endonuclease [Microbacterium phage Roman]